MRLFVGIELPPDVRRRLAGLASGLPGARWVPPENLHISLRFIGEVDNHHAEDIDAVLAGIHAPAFELSLSGIGFFDSGPRVHAVWAGVGRSEALAFLHDKVESAVVRAGLEPERRKFKPHVTLARLKETPPRERLAAFMEHHEPFRCEPFEVAHFTLFRSHLGNEGSHYEPLSEYPLAGAAG
jgi:2'-5' RNA ligase